MAWWNPLGWFDDEDENVVQDDYDEYEWWNPADWFGYHDEPSMFDSDQEYQEASRIKKDRLDSGVEEFDEFQWYNPADWFGSHDEETMWDDPETLTSLLGGIGGFALGGSLGGLLGYGAGPAVGGLLGFGGQRNIGQAALGGSERAVPDAVLSPEEMKRLGLDKAPELAEGGYNEDAFLQDFFAERDRYKDKRGELEQEVRDFRDSPSVVDEQLRKNYAMEQAALANAYAGRSGAGYLEDFNNQKAMRLGRMADEGATARLQEDLGRQQLLTNVLGQVQDRDRGFTGLLGNIHGQGRGFNLDKYRTDLGQQLGLLGHQRGLADLDVKRKYLDIASKKADPFSTQNILSNIGSVVGSDQGQKWLGKGIDKIAGLFA